MSKEESRLEQASRHLMFGIDLLGKSDKLTPDIVLELANRVMFEKAYPHVGKELDNIYEVMDSLYSKHMELENRVYELEKRLSEKK